VIKLSEAIDLVVEMFVKGRQWKLAAKEPDDRHAASFIRRRAGILFRANPKWLEEDTKKPPFPLITSRLTSELEEIARYLTDKVGDEQHRGPLFGGTDPTTPNHLDLADKAQRRTNEPSTTLAAALANGHNDTQKRVRAYLGLRRTRAKAIVWRAVALHETLWLESADHTTALLNRGAMSEVLDRRLRTLEWMNFTISDHRWLGGNSQRTLNGPTGPWLDGFRIRMFEYPRFPGDIPDYRRVLAGQIAPDGSNQFRYNQKFAWVPSDNGELLLYNLGPFPGIHFFNDAASPPTGLRTSFLQTGPRTMRLRIVPAAGQTVANVVDQVFTPNTNIWQRSWLFCDHVLAALHIEALLFAMRRRSTDGTQRFNAIAAANPAGFFSFDNLMGGDGAQEFGADRSDTADRTWIENRVIPIADLQPGDHIIFFNSQLYRFLSSGDWNLENSLVMDVDSDPKTGGIDVNSLELQGHGTDLRIYAKFQKDISDHLKKPLKAVVEAVKNRPPGATEVTFKDTRVVSWTPYDSFLAPGAWWIEINIDPNVFEFATIAQALDSIPKSLALDPHPQPGYTPPPRADAVYFPLFEPQETVEIKDETGKVVNRLTGWAAYLFKRQRPNFRPNRRLAQIRPDGSLLPGLYRPGSLSARKDNVIHVIRPAVIP
jgi:hypothetical protein